MKIEHITIQGLLRFHEPVSLAVRDLPAGLIAFCGLNGQGKTTMLESPLATFFRQLPSRADKPLVDFVTRSDGFTEVTFELEGQGLYTARVSLDGPHRVSDAILTRVLPGESRSVFLNDGKLKTYDTAIAELLPPQSLMLASVFASQNRHGSFSQLDRKGRADLFASLLGLDHLAELSSRAKSAAGLTQTEIDKLTARRDALAHVGSAVEADLEQRAQQLQAEGGQLEADQRLLGHDVRNLEQRLTVVAEASARHAVATARAGQIVTEIAARTAELDRARADVGRVHADLVRDTRVAITDLTTRLATIDSQRRDTSVRDAERRQADETLRTTIATADLRIANNQGLLAERPAIREAVDTVASADVAIGEFRASLAESASQVSALLNSERVHLTALRAIELAQKDLDRANDAQAVIGQVPFGDACATAQCRFLTDATAAQVRIPALRALIAPKSDTEAALTGVQARIAEFGDTTRTLQAAITELEDSKAIAQPLADKQAQLTQAEERIAHWTQRKDEARAAQTQQLADADLRHAARLEDLHRQRTGRETEHQQDVARLQTRAAGRREELAAQERELIETLERLQAEGVTVGATVEETADANARTVEWQALLAGKRREYETCVAALARVEAQRQEMARRVDAERARREEVACVEAQLTALTGALIEWTLLAKALGRDGLPVLEIDAAGPTVSAYTNDLLQTCFGSRFTVDLVTQEARTSKGKDGSLYKDAFELKVYDAERGGDARDLSDLSGGEQVLVDEALKSAIALLVNQRNPHPLRTCWRDETTGALHPETAPKYVDMLRRVHELGGFHQTLFVSHNPDAWLQADAQVHFAGGHVSVALPPYGRVDADHLARSVA